MQKQSLNQTADRATKHNSKQICWFTSELIHKMMKARKWPEKSSFTAWRQKKRKKIMTVNVLLCLSWFWFSASWCVSYVSYPESFWCAIVSLLMHTRSVVPFMQKSKTIFQMPQVSHVFKWMGCHLGGLAPSAPTDPIQTSCLNLRRAFSFESGALLEKASSLIKLYNKHSMSTSLSRESRSVVFPGITARIEHLDLFCTFVQNASVITLCLRCTEQKSGTRPSGLMPRPRGPVAIVWLLQTPACRVCVTVK